MNHISDLFDSDLFDQDHEISPDIYLFRNKVSWSLWSNDIKAIIKQSPLRFMRTPGGKRLNISMTNCGDMGWTSGEQGYRYVPRDPASGKPWPELPASFARLGIQIAKQTGFELFQPNACLVNHYQVVQ